MTIRRFFTFYLGLGLLSMVLFSCSKNMSSDTPLNPVYYPSIIISSDNQFVYSFDLTTGVKHWEYNVNDDVFASPLLYNGMVYIPALNGIVYKLDARSGKLVSKFILNNGAYQLMATPIAFNNLLFFGATNDSMYAVDTATNSIKWRFGTGNKIVSSPTISNGKLVFASYDGNVYCLDATSGLSVWTYTTANTDSFYSSPAVNGSFVFIGGLNKTMYELHMSDGSLVWKMSTQGSIQSSPTIFGGHCIFGCNDYRVYCLDSIKGKIIWADSTSDRVISSPVPDINNQTIVIGSDDGHVYSLNILNGTTKWSFTSPLNYMFESSPIVYNGIVYAGGFDKYLYALDPATGNIKWKQNINGVIRCSPVIDDLGTGSTNSGISGFTN